MKIIAVVGPPASGKGEFSRIARSMGIPVVVMGDVIRKETARAGLPITDANLGETANRLREEKGMAAIAELSLPEILAGKAPVVLVDGIRGDTEVAFFRSRFGEFYLVGVDASFGTRLARLGARGREDDRLAAEDLRERDRREISWGLGRALSMADTVICNDGEIGDFEAAVRALLEEIRGEP